VELPGIKNTRSSNLLPKDGEVEFISHFVEEDHLQGLIDNIKWTQDKMNMFGKVVNLPRLTAWYGDPKASYTYSGITNKPLPWTELLLALKKKVESYSGAEFNSVLLNYYRDQRDHMSWHNDDEKELGHHPVIASLSFGEPRLFQFKHLEDKTIEKISLSTETGSLILMKGETQKYWSHRIAKTSLPMGPRVNLTFRKISF
jgi:alkylated DNA repair dioxygenase AlkB